MQKHYWIYQQRQSESEQWAIHVVKNYQKGIRGFVSIDITIFSEDIQNSANSITLEGLKFQNPSSYVSAVASEITDFSSVTAMDRSQLEAEFSQIIKD